MGQGGSGPDYRPEIDKALNQANQPKSDLSQAFSGLAQGALPDLFSILSNTNQLGNSFITRQGQSSAGINGGMFNPRPNALNFAPRTSAPMNGAINPSGGTNNPGRFSLNFNNAFAGTNGGGGGGTTPANPNNPTSGYPSVPYTPPAREPRVGVNDPFAGRTELSNGSFLSPGFSADGNGNIVGPDGSITPYNSSNAIQSRDQILAGSNAIQPTINNPNPGNNGAGLPTAPGGDTFGGTSGGNSGLNLDLQFPDYAAQYGAYNPTGYNNDATNPNYANAADIGRSIFSGRGTQNVGGGALSIPDIMAAMNSMQGLDLSALDPNALSRLSAPFNMNDTSSYNPSAGLLDSGGLTGIPSLTNAITQSLSGGLNYQGNAGSGMAGGLNTNPLGGYDPANDSGFQAIQDVLNNKFNKDEADLREGFIDTGTGRSTGQTYAQAQLRGQELPQLSAALADYIQRSQSNSISNANVGNSAILQNQGQGNTFRQGNAGINTSLLGTLFNGGLGQGNINTSLANNAGNTSLGRDTLNTGNQLQTQGLNSNNANSILSALNTYMSNKNSSIVGQNSLTNNLNQFNANQNNSRDLSLAGMNQSANESSLARNLQGLLSLFGAGGTLAGAGIPGGSANVNVSNQVASGSGLGGILGGLGGILSGLSGFKS